jgi:Na+/H+ antiporter NhaA
MVFMSVTEEPPAGPGPGSTTPPAAGGTPARTTQGREGRGWSGRTENPLALFARTETAGAVALVTAAVAALVWSNIDIGSYNRTWQTVLSIRLGGRGVSLSLQGWINSGLMSFFFFVVGLEARRELDIGDLRQRDRIILPVLAGVTGMIGAVALYLVINIGSGHLRGWGAAMSTDTAFALGVLALIRPPFVERLRVFVLTVMVVDDIVALVVVATMYSGHVSVVPLVVAIGLVGLMLVLLWQGVSQGGPYLVLALPAWVALSKSGVDPVVLGLIMGLLTYAAPAARQDLERATDLFRGFREQPTPELARVARVGLRAALAPNERLEVLFHPWTSFVIVPLFAFANLGIVINGSFLAHGLQSPVTLGIALGYALGKPAGVVVMAAITTRLSRGRLRPPVGWLSVTGAGTLAGMAFTVSLLVAALAFHGPALEDAKLGILLAPILSTGLTWVVFRVATVLPPRTRIRLLLGVTETLTDLAYPVDPARDHIRGPEEALVTLVEYADFECPYCGQAEPVVRQVLSGFGDVRYVWRHLPLVDVHPRAKMAALAAEAAGAQGAFWPMHDLLLAHQSDLRPNDLAAYAEQMGLDVERFYRDIQNKTGGEQIATDVEGADLSGVAGTPSFFINGRRHEGSYDVDSLTEAIHLAKSQALLAR